MCCLAGPALLKAKESGRYVIIKEAMANARLTPRNADPAFAHKLRLLCDTAAQVSFHWVGNAALAECCEELLEAGVFVLNLGPQAVCHFSHGVESCCLAARFALAATQALKVTLDPSSHHCMCSDH